MSSFWKRRWRTLAVLVIVLFALGFGVGISSGANLLGAVQVAHEQGPESAVCTVFPDSNRKYLSTDLVRPEEVRTGYLTPDVELLGCRVARRDPGTTS